MTHRMKPRSALAAMHETNLMAAEIIHANPVKYQGLMAEWAMTVLANESRRVNGLPMRYSTHDVAKRANAPLQPLQPSLAAAFDEAAEAVPQVPQRVVEQRAHTQDRPRQEGREAPVAGRLAVAS